MTRRPAYARSDTPLDERRAWAVIRPHWEEVVRTFERKGHPEVKKADVEIDAKWHDSCRHFAAMSTDGDLLALAPQIADLPVENIVALLAHEAGHLVDFLNPGRFWFRPASQVHVREGCRVLSVLDVDPAEKGPVLFWFEHLPTKNLAKHMQEWKQRDKDETERTADAIASAMLGQYIGYTGPEDCLIQCVGSGIPRPKGLR